MEISKTKYNMKIKTTDIIEETKKVFGKYLSGNELTVFLKKINTTHLASAETGQKISTELFSSHVRLVIDQVISFAETKLSILNFLDLLKDLGKLFIAHGELDLASDLTTTLLSYTKKDKRLVGVAAYSFLNFGEIFIHQAMWTESLFYIKKALSFFNKENDPLGMARCESLLGTLYAEKGQLSNALKHFHKGFSYLDPSKDTSMVALIENNIGIVYNIQGEYDSAYTYFRRALLHFEGLKDSQRIGKIRHNLGMLLSKRKNTTLQLRSLMLALPSLFQLTIIPLSPFLM